MTNDVPEFSFPAVAAPNPAVPDAVVTPPPAPARASGKKALVIALVLALVAVVALGAFSAYLWNVHSQYVAQNEELRDTATTLGGELAASRAKAEEAQSQLDDVNAQLADAKDTISELANSEAHAGDDRQALIDVADGLQQCADARQNLINHLDEAYKWTTASLRANEAATTTYCNKVIKAYKAVLDD